MNADNKDLMQEFFKRDLTEAEDEALAGELKDSVEATSRFSGLMAAHWARLGLAVPKPAAATLKYWIVGGLAAAAGLAALIPLALRPDLSRVAPLADGPAYHVEAAPAAAPARARVSRALPVLEVAASQVAGGFAVTVDQPARGDARVFVTDSHGYRLASLHHGALSAGRHAFTWKGQPGRYRICLETPDGVQGRWVQIGRQP